MRAVTTVIAALGILGALTASGPARAHDDNDAGDWRRQEWQEHHRREQRWREQEWREQAWHADAPPVAYAPQNYYAPQPTYYAPPPTVYYARPPTAYYVPAPPPPRYEAPGFSIGFSFR